MIIDVEDVKKDLEEAKAMDIDAEFEKRVAELRDEIVAERDDRIEKLEALLDLIDECYEDADDDECDEDDDCDGDADDEAEAEEPTQEVEE